MVLELIIGIIIGVVIAYFIFKSMLEARIEEVRKETLETQRAVLKGKISEQLAAILPEFKYNSADARFIGNPIDYIIFDGYTRAQSEKEFGDIEIIFMDVKKGKSTLSAIQRKIKNAVEKGKVKWETLRLGD